jgi:ribosome-associated protein
LTPKTLAKKIANLTLTKKAHDVLVMDLKKLTDVADYFVICSADSEPQVKAISEAVLDGTAKSGLDVWRSEGLSERHWIILDYVDVVVHIFLKDVRKFYNLDKLWGDAKIEIVEDKPEPAIKPKIKHRRVKVERVSKK